MIAESDRLHYIVRAIETDCNIVPVGAFKLTTDHEVRRNETFKGLDEFRAFDISSYQHFRNVLSQEKKEGLERDDAIFKPNFLDSAVGDDPRG